MATGHSKDLNKALSIIRFGLLPALLLGLFTCFAPRAGAADPGTAGPDGSLPEDDIVQAKAYLKQHLKELNRQYPFPEWERQLAKARKGLDRAREKASQGGAGFNRGFQSSLAPLSQDITALLRRKTEAEKLIRELYVQTLVSRIESMFAKEGRRMHPDAKLSFQRALMPYEQGSLKPKHAFVADISALDREFRRLQTDWLHAFAQDFLGRRVDEHLKANNFAQNEAVYDDYALQLEYWTREIDGNAPQALEQLEALSRKHEAAKGRIREDLEGLLEVLNTDMLFSDLLEYARKQEVDITLEVEERIEASLKERSQATVAPVQERLAAWKSFPFSLKDRIAQARAKADQQRSQQLAREEIERRERERMEALREEQERQAREQKEKFKQTLTELKTFTFKTETSVELDDESKQALKTKAGFLKTSYVNSGQNKLRVDKGAKFSDTLAFVQKFKVDDRGVDFSKMSLQERTNQSAYTYASPSGRTSNADLQEFVAEVALGSFSTYYSFLSYLAPSRWRPGRLAWMPDRAQEKAVADREFSYVDLVVDAHRKRQGTGGTRGEHVTNLPANMIVIFNPGGAIIRFQAFSDIDNLSILPGDLVGGKLHYKFLNYSVDRRNIYLNGIDQEMKVSTSGP